jgi:AraC family transcriptional regulator
MGGRNSATYLLHKKRQQTKSGEGARHNGLKVYYQMLTNSLPISASRPVYLDGHAARPPLDGSNLTGPHRNAIYNGRFHSTQANEHDPSVAPDGLPPYSVQVLPSEPVRRRSLSWAGMAAEFVELTSHERVECRFKAPVHLLIVYEQGMRREGETFVEGLPRSALRDLSRKLTFVPAGHEYHAWQEPRTLTRLMYIYIDPATLQSHAEIDIGDSLLAPRLYIEDKTLWDTALKIRRSIENPTIENRHYSEALGIVLMHEIMRLNRGAPRVEPQIKGGLAAWQQKAVTTYIEEHVAERISLATLAQLARLSPYYFCRAFKQSFGIPPHRYHTNRRIEHAKALLAQRDVSVTDIGMSVGFSETSSFSAAFRKATGVTPSSYHRSLG